jgi:hypothetical protein
MIADSKHNWAYGCMNCSYGVRDEHYTAPTGGVELVLERLIAAERIGPAYFCECEAGTHLRAHLAQVRERYAKRMQTFEGQDVQIGNVILAAARVAMSKPWMQFEHKAEREKGAA